LLLADEVLKNIHHLISLSNLYSS